MNPNAWYAFSHIALPAMVVGIIVVVLDGLKENKRKREEKREVEAWKNRFKDDDAV